MRAGAQDVQLSEVRSLPGPQVDRSVSGSPRRRATAGQSQAQPPSPCRGDEVIAVASMNYDPIVSKVAEVLASGRAIRKREVE